MLKKILAAAALALGLVAGGGVLSGAHAAGACVTADVNINGQGTGGPQTVCTPELPAAPALP